MDNKISWDSFKSISHLKDYGSNPVLKVIRKIHLLQEIKDPDNQTVHYVSRRAFKKWTHTEGLELYKASVSLEDIAKEIQFRRSSHLTEVNQKLRFPVCVPPYVQTWVKTQVVEKAPDVFNEKMTVKLEDHSEVRNHLLLEWNEKGFLEKIELNGEPLSWKEEIPTLNWPRDLSSLEISPENKRFIHSYITEHFSSWKGLKAPLKLKKGSGGLPLSFYVIPDKEGNIARLVLLTKVVIGKGGIRVIKQGYDLMQGHRVARKTIDRFEELEAQKTMQGKGAPEILAEVRKQKAGIGEVMQVMEPVYQGSLDKLFDSNLNEKDCRDIAKELLRQLAGFHQKKAGSINAYHGDIKPKNILYREASDSEIEVAISDYGAANRTQGFEGTSEYFSPEFAKLLTAPNLNPQKRSMVMDNYRKEYAQKGDVWAMGLTVLQLLTKGEWPTTYQKIFESRNPFDMRRKLRDLSQEAVNQDLDDLKKKHHPNSPLWDVVRKMLVVIPEERCTAAEALALLP